MPQIPEIKTDVNKEPERDKKKAGFLLRLFGGASAGTGGMGGFGGAAAGGGLLATKAGLLAVILAGSTVAGSIAFLGYRLFIPSDARLSGKEGNLSVFALKSKDGGGAGGQNAGKNGAPSDASLQYLADANKTAQSAGGVTADAAKDGQLAGAAAEAVAGSAATGGAGHAGDASSGNGVNKTLKNVAKFGELSKGSSGGGSGASASAGPISVGKSDAAAGRGSLSAMKRGPARAGGTSRSLSRRGARGGVREALGVLGDQGRAGSSFAAGHTYQGSDPKVGGNIGGGSAIEAGGIGTGAGAQQPKSLPNAANDSTQIKPPPTPTATDAAPWQNAIQTAQMLIGAAIALLLIAKWAAKQPDWGKIAAQVIGGIVAIMGAMVISLGAQISNGPYAQTLQGGLLAAAGAGMVLAGGMAALADNAFTDKGEKAGFMDGIDPMILLGGGLGLVGLAGTMMLPPKKYPSTDFQNGTPPDVNWFGYRQAPTETALKRYLV